MAKKKVEMEEVSEVEPIEFNANVELVIDEQQLQLENRLELLEKENATLRNKIDFLETEKIEKLKKQDDFIKITKQNFLRGSRVFIKNRQSEPFYVQEVVGTSIRNENLYKVNSLVQDLELVIEESKMSERLVY